MAPRIFGGGAWGYSSSVSTPYVAIIAVVALFLGILGGSLVAKVSQGRQTGSGQALAGNTFQDLNNGDNSELGAVRAATSFINAMPDVSILPEMNRLTAINEVVAQNISEEDKDTITFVLKDLGTELRPGAAQSTSRVVTMPAVFKSGTYEDGYAITVWYSTVIADPTGAKFRNIWQTVDLALVFEDGGWKVSKMQRKFGPTPALLSPGGQSGNYSEVQPVLDQSWAFRHGTPAELN